MPNPHRRWIMLMVLTLPLATGCAPRVPPAPPVYSNDPKLIPELDPILALPQYPRPQPNGYEVLAALTKRLNKSHELKGDFTGGTYHAVSHEAELAAAPAQLADNAAVLAELRQSLNLEWLYPHAPQADLLSPELAAARYPARLLTWEAEIKAQAGETEEAVADILGVLTLAVKLPRGGGLMQWLVGHTSESLAFRTQCPMVAGHRLSAEILTSLARQLTDLQRQKVPLREIIAFGYECQGPQTLNLKPWEFAELLAATQRPAWFKAVLHLPGARAVTRGFIAGRLPDVMQWDAKIARLSTQPFYAARRHIPSSGGDASMLVLCPFPRGALARQAESQIRWRAAQIMIALELHRNRRGAYPPSPDYSSSVTRENR
ncbi:MAG: hypothetical protein KKI08_21545, partial [Armatimonadetes bacterium]|nr:hypothetical protein [Armatimonadota bacterium]